MGQAQGVMLLAASKAKVRYLNMLPVQLKNDNRFRTRKQKEVQEHIRKILGDRVKSVKGKKTHFDNEADAHAIALTHAFKITEGGD